mmetsp:Transcript_47976/g.96615  ORF Transcript_47976/g.96615 Transcript_47976/m.96615 type:complete len:245 (-) Transcript_47976:91-825(-)
MAAAASSASSTVLFVEAPASAAALEEGDGGGALPPAPPCCWRWQLLASSYGIRLTSAYAAARKSLAGSLVEGLGALPNDDDDNDAAVASLLAMSAPGRQPLLLWLLWLWRRCLCDVCLPREASNCLAAAGWVACKLPRRQPKHRRAASENFPLFSIRSTTATDSPWRHKQSKASCSTVEQAHEGLEAACASFVIASAAAALAVLAFALSARRSSLWACLCALAAPKSEALSKAKATRGESGISL